MKVNIFKLLSEKSFTKKNMKFKTLEIEGPVVCIPNFLNDKRGFFAETYRKDLLENFTGTEYNFCQSNLSKSKKGVLRGLHFQVYPYAQTKLVSVSQGEILDLILDIRKESKTFGKGIQIILNETNRYKLLVPKGFAHGFLTLSNFAEVNYQVDNYYNKDCEFGINSLDPKLNFDLERYCNKIIRSQKDSISPNLEDSPIFKFHQ